MEGKGVACNNLVNTMSTSDQSLLGEWVP